MNTHIPSQRVQTTTADALNKQLPVATKPVGNEVTQTAQAVQGVSKPQETELTAKQLEEMAEQVESFVSTFNRGLKFRVDEDSGRHIVTVLDSDTGDVVRQIPSEELLDVITRLSEASRGLIDTKA
ncbi:flagellin FlaG [Oceanimonas sp. GK1]|uniref:flagellar protein FlaG n=1 Tax=Oceanimonas sp. (strain GK1 / IBRC-M 10197) TaxID=511062 RepID=UPI0002495488|nr:flagellar protein FlaG [Oceanimonas sp. GK1]AEY02443.1 flagellin FlaG [Oceanimonas sp. GK1]